MAYLAKSTLLQAYKTLSDIDENKQQGLTQKVSALRYLFALDRFYKVYNKDCDTKIQDKNKFVDFVGEVVKLSDATYTSNFYLGIYSEQDYKVGSNFFSVNAVKDSLVNPAIVVEFPRRNKDGELFKIQNGVLLYDTSLFKHINTYLLSDSVKIAFALWLVRSIELEGESYNDIKQALQKRYSVELVKELLPTESVFQDFFKINDWFKTDYIEASIVKDDIVSLFSINSLMHPYRDYSSFPLQIIYFGAPGTGKSHEIKKLTKGESVIRTTFHPDSDYSTFVGCYKPTMADIETHVVPVVINNGISLDQNNGTYKEKRISYRFVMQAFIKAYLGAWKKMADADDDKVAPQFLIIEEINRGNCAQIFGDLFQLLDRDDNGFSEYPIEADTDLQQEIERVFKEHNDYKLNNAISVEGAVEDYISNYGATLSEDIQSGRVLLLPPNLYIWATMNTSDQSLFPIDSAFKRRWEWKYLPINNHKDKNYKIEIGSTKYDWWGFLSKINQVIGDTTSSEDKKLGYFFAKADTNGIVTAEQFVGKVLFYLWNDVFKNYGFDNQIFDKGDKKKFDFSEFFKQDGSPDTDMVNKFLGKLDETIDKENTFVEKPIVNKGQEELSDTEV